MKISKKKCLLFSFVILVCLTQCTNSANTEAELSRKLKEAESAKQKLEDSIKQNNLLNNRQSSIDSSVTKSIYIEIKTNEPVPTMGQIYDGEKSIGKEDPNYLVYYSDIIEIENFNEDKQYKEMDKFQDKVKEKLITSDKHYSDLGTGYIRISKIISRKAFVFNNYKDASISRNEKVD